MFDAICVAGFLIIAILIIIVVCGDEQNLARVDIIQHERRKNRQYIGQCV